MPEKVMPGPVSDTGGIREAVCIHTRKIYDSCREEDIALLRYWSPNGAHANHTGPRTKARGPVCTFGERMAEWILCLMLMEEPAMLFETFTPIQPADSTLCARYQDRLPEPLLHVWRKYGFGTFLNGYLKMVNPEDYQDLLQETCTLGNTAVPIFATSLADLIVWDRNHYLRILHYPAGTIQGMAAGFQFFWADLEEGAFHDRFFNLPLYEASVARLGLPRFQECFGCVPLPALGGRFRPENLRRCGLQEYIALICQVAGGLGL